MTKNSQDKVQDSINCSTIKNFTQIPNALLRNPEISGKAKAILCLLLSNKKGWKSYIITIDKMMKEGIDAIRSGIKELEQAGYLKRVKYRDKETKIWKGSFWAYTDQVNKFDFTNYIKKLASCGCEISDIQYVPQVENPHVDNPEMENPHVDNPTLIILNSNNTDNNNTKNKRNLSKDKLTSDKSDVQPSNDEPIAEDKIKEINIIFKTYINIASELKLLSESFKLTKHKSINTKIGINNHTESISIKKLIFDALQLYDSDTIIKCLNNYKLICMNQNKYWYKSYWNNISILRSESLLKLLDLESLKIKELDCFSAARYNTTFLTLGEFDSKTPLDTETNTYMSIDTETLKKRDIQEYYDDIKLYIKTGEFEKNISYFQWLEECIICLIYRKTDKILLQELLDLHKYWYRHFKVMSKKEE